MKRFSLIIMMSASLLPAATFSFELLPGGGAIQGNAGSSIGWGYSLANESPDEWLLTTSLNSDPFVSATPTILFNFPILPPGATVVQPYDSIAGTGLVELLLSSYSGNSVINSGQFEIEAQWWSGNPFAGGAYLADATPALQAYQAIATATPEPSSTAMVVIGLAALSIVFVKRSVAVGRQQA